MVLLRGINVGGKNNVPMVRLRQLLENLGYTDVATYIASGNAILASDKPPARMQVEIEDALPRAFKLDSDVIRVMVLSRKALQAVIDDRPEGFGDQPERYHSDAIFLMGTDAKEAMTAFAPRDGVDRVWPGKGVIYSQRLSAERTRSRLNKAISSPLYKSMTIRNWNTTTKLLGLLAARDGK